MDGRDEVCVDGDRFVDDKNVRGGNVISGVGRKQVREVGKMFKTDSQNIKYSFLTDYLKWVGRLHVRQVTDNITYVSGTRFEIL